MTAPAPSVARTRYDGADLARELARAKASFPYFLANHVSIADRTPEGQLLGVLQWEWWPLHDEVCGLLARDRRMVWLKARQEGFSWLLAAWQLHGAMFTANFLGGVVSAGETEAAEFLNKASFIRAHLPYTTIPTLKTENKSELRFVATDGAIIAFPSTRNAGRGYTFTRWVTDEAAFHEYAAVNYEAYSIAAEYGQIVIVSSAGNEDDRGVANPWFKAHYQAARDGRNGFSAHFFGYDRRPGRDAAWYAREEQRLSGRPGAMQREFPRTEAEAFASMVLLFLDGEAIDEGIANALSPLPATSALPAALHRYTERGHLRLWSLPRPGVPYVLACDGAEGKGLDYTVTQVYEARTLRHVATLRERELEPAEHGVAAAALAKWFNDAWCIVERSHGEVILTQLAVAGCRVYRHVEEPTRAQRESGRLPEGTVGFPMTGQTRTGLLDDFAQAVHDRSFSSPDAVLWQEARTFVVVVNDAGHKRAQAAAGSHDDMPLAAALAVRMARQPGAQSVRVVADFSLGSGNARPRQGPSDKVKWSGAGRRRMP